MLKQRILTAVILLPLVLWALFGLSDQLLMGVFGLILLVGAWEWSRLADLHQHITQATFLFVEAMLMLLGAWLLHYHPAIVPAILVSAVLGWFVILYWLIMFERGSLVIHMKKSSKVLLGILLLPVTFISISFILTTGDNDRLYILLMFLLIWGADTAAYFAGRALGKNKLAPQTSPGKTWEGVMGAMVMTMLIAGIAWSVMNYSFAMLPKLMFFSILVVILSIVGDLFESLLKRQAGVKDSSHILPGHGGILDRIDSMIAASPVYALGLYLLGMY